MIRNCANCGSENTAERHEIDTWKVSYEGLSELSASIPVTRCLDCGQQFSDERSEDIRELITKTFDENWLMQSSNLDT